MQPEQQQLTISGMVAEMARLIDGLPPPPWVVVHPDDERAVRAAVRRLPFDIPLPDVKVSRIVPRGKLIVLPGGKPEFNWDGSGQW